MGIKMSDYFSFLQEIAEQEIQKSIKRGDLDNLPGKGKPLKLDDDSHISPELRMAYRILKNAGYTTSEIEERREISNILELLENCEDEQLCYQQVQKLNLLVTKINEQRRSPVYLELDQRYYQKVVQRVKINKQIRNKGKL